MLLEKYIMPIAPDIARFQHESLGNLHSWGVGAFMVHLACRKFAIT